MKVINLLATSLIFMMMAVPHVQAAEGGEEMSKNYNSLNLSTRLHTLEQKARSRRLWTGGSWLAVGAGSAALGGISKDEQTGLILAIAGTGMAVGGGLILFSKSESETLPQQFSAHPEETDDQIANKIIMGESYLKKLSNKERNQRIIFGSALIVGGLAGSALALSAEEHNRGEVSILLYSSLLWAGMGIADLFKKRPAELEWAAYKAWRSTEAATSSWNLTPINRGLGLALNASF